MRRLDAAAKAIAGVIDVVRLPYGVGVLAKTPWAAFSAKSALESAVTWQRSGKAWGFDSDKGLDAFAHDAGDLTMPTVDWYKQGDAEAALAKAASVVEAEYRCQYAYHAQMEPLSAVASVSAAGDTAEVWCGTQYPTGAQAAVAKALDIPAERIKLNYTLLGGGFGRRGDYAQEFVVDAAPHSHEYRPAGAGPRLMSGNKRKLGSPDSVVLSSREPHLVRFSTGNPDQICLAYRGIDPPKRSSQISHNWCWSSRS